MHSRLPLPRLRALAAPLALVLLAACGGDGPTPAPPPVPAAVSALSGSGQQGAAGTALPTQLVARVVDGQGRAMAGVNVTWAVTAGGGTLSPTTSATDASGEARAQWTLGTTAGPNAATATVAALAAQFTATGVAGPAATVVATPETVTLEMADLGQLAATAKDAFGNSITDRTIQWSVVQGTAVTVNASGMVMTQAAGTAKVAAALEGRADTVDVTVLAAPTTRYQAISAGGVATCALGMGGALYCWGANYGKQLGRASGGDLCDGQDCSLVPVLAQTQERFDILSAGRDGGCAINLDRRLYCWGKVDNEPAAATPAQVAPSAQTVGVGESFYCFGVIGGATTCRGINDYGQIGTGSADRFTGGTVSGGNVFVQIDAGTSHACGITAQGAAFCWGRNDKGQLGAPTTDVCNGIPCSRVPLAVAGGNVFRQIVVGREFTCGLTDLDMILCWGSNHTGQVGSGSTAATVATPTEVAGGQTFRELDASGLSEYAGHACGVTTSGMLFCWGANARGELGTAQQLGECSTPQGPYTCSRVPVRVADPVPVDSWRRVATGMVHTCAVTTRDRTYCWGENIFGQLGDGTRANRSAPVIVRDPRT